MKKWAIVMLIGIFVFSACTNKITDDQVESELENKGYDEHSIDSHEIELPESTENIGIEEELNTDNVEIAIDEIPIHREFLNESFSTSNGNISVNYDQSALVLLPMYESVNQDLLKPINFQLGGDRTLTLAVFGKINNVKVGYIESPDFSGLWFPYGDVENVFIQANVDLPFDTSSIVVLGTYLNSVGESEEIRIVLNDMKETQDYQIIIR